MPRWEHGSAERLKKAALELFDERGFENTSVVEIAERARVTTRTFFRYFSDKREVLFAESAGLRSALVREILDAPSVEEPLRVVVTALSAFDWEALGRDLQRRRQAVIAANPELLERELVKNDMMIDALAGVLRERGVAAHTARLASRVGAQVFLLAYHEWLAADDGATLPARAENALSLLGSLVTAGTPHPPTSQFDRTTEP